MTFLSRFLARKSLRVRLHWHVCALLQLLVHALLMTRRTLFESRYSCNCVDARSDSNSESIVVFKLHQNNNHNHKRGVKCEDKLTGNNYSTSRQSGLHRHGDRDWRGDSYSYSWQYPPSTAKGYWQNEPPFWTPAAASVYLYHNEKIDVDCPTRPQSKSQSQQQWRPFPTSATTQDCMASRTFYVMGNSIPRQMIFGMLEMLGGSTIGRNHQKDMCPKIFINSVSDENRGFSCQTEFAGVKLRYLYLSYLDGFYYNSRGDFPYFRKFIRLVNSASDANIQDQLKRGSRNPPSQSTLARLNTEPFAKSRLVNLNDANQQHKNHPSLASKWKADPRSGLAAFANAVDKYCTNAAQKVKKCDPTNKVEGQRIQSNVTRATKVNNDCLRAQQQFALCEMHANITRELVDIQFGEDNCGQRPTRQCLQSFLNHSHSNDVLLFSTGMAYAWDYNVTNRLIDVDAWVQDSAVKFASALGDLFAGKVFWMTNSFLKGPKHTSRMNAALHLDEILWKTWNPENNATMRNITGTWTPIDQWAINYNRTNEYDDALHFMGNLTKATLHTVLNHLCF